MSTSRTDGREHMSYQYLLFDLDGTLTDPGIGITNSVMHALKKYNINVNDRACLYKFIGPPLIDSFMEFYNFSREQAEQAVIYYREYFMDKGLFENQPYEDIEHVLETLKAKQKTLIVATSKLTIMAEKILEHFKLRQYFADVVGSNMDNTRTTKSEVIQYILDNRNITDLKQAIMIGDRKHDIIGAKTCGLDSIGVLYGYGDQEEHRKAGATYIAKYPKDILPYVL